MPAILALHEWTPAEAHELTGVSPGLQRQYRKMGVLTPLGEKRTRYNIVTVAYPIAARALIDNGAPSKEIQQLVNGLGAQIFHSAVKLGRVDVDAAVSRDEAVLCMNSWPGTFLSTLLAKRYFAFRNDPPAIGSPHRSLAFDDFADMEDWLAKGDAERHLDDTTDIFTGKPIPPPTAEEVAEMEAEETEDDRRWAARLAFKRQPLPPSAAAVIIDAHTLARELLEKIGGAFGEIYDTEKMGIYDHGRDAALADGMAKLEALSVELSEENRASLTPEQVTAKVGEVKALSGQVAELAWQVSASMKRFAERPDYPLPIKDIPLITGASAQEVADQ